MALGILEQRPSPHQVHHLLTPQLSDDGAQIKGTWAQGGQTFPLDLTRGDASSMKGPNRPQEPKPPLPYESEDVTYANPHANITLAGTLTRPRAAGPFPVVLLITGSGPQDRDETVMAHKPFLVLSDYLTRQGLAVLRVDDRGVGKSTVSANLAVALARAGHAVGLMDADIYGPNIPRMMGVDEKPPVQGGKIQPLEAHGVKLMSLGFIVERDQPAIWRGPIIMKIIQQFLRDVDWGELDYFLVDLPPGTGDAQLSLVQTIHLHGALIVTTPQEVATGDSLRGAKMFERVGTKVLGVVENMSYYVCEHCGERSELFQSGGGERLAAELGVPLLGQIPLQAGLARLADGGQPIVASQPDSPAAKALADTARQVAALLQSARSGPLPVTR